MQLPGLHGAMTMPTDQTRTAILNAAERLYADRGFGEVTLRDIVAAAEVNLAAVNYHFGSKDELIAELFVTRGPPGHIRSDNGPEFIATAVQKWLDQVGVKTRYIVPGSP